MCHIPEESVQVGATIIHQMDSIYDAFADKMAEMQIDPPCGCNACSNITMLDLKMFLHYGEYLVKTVGTSEEILGSDVITAHRMMKNDVAEKTGIRSYLLMTGTAFDKLELSRGPDFIDYSQTYEHIGKVDMHVSQLGSSDGITYQPGAVAQN